MKLFNKKLDVLSLIAIVILALSINLIDFENLSRNNNIKGYIGLIVVFILALMKLYLVMNTKRNSR
jgi:uncharacterized membrane protein